MPITSRVHRMLREPQYMVMLVAVINMVAFFPGTMTPDAENQLDQAISGDFHDLHPPVMAVVWSMLLRFPGGEAGIFFLHQLVYWSAIAILAVSMVRTKEVATAWWLIGASLFPYFIHQNQLIVKDAGVSVFLLLAFAIAHRRETLNQQWGYFGLILFSLALTYGVLARSNAVFALGPLLILTFPKAWRKRFGLIFLLFASVFISILAIFTSDFINYKLLEAKSRDRTQSIQIFDTMGIAVLSGDAGVLKAWSIGLDEARDCYTPFWWDTFAPYGVCAQYREKMGIPTGGLAEKEAREIRTQQWLTAIQRHPIDYIRHRIYHFNSSIHFVVPAFHHRYSMNKYANPHSDDIDLRKKIQQDYFKKSFLMWPVFWLTVGVFFLAVAGQNDKIREDLFLYRMLALSGVLYGLGYAVVGVASDPRYYYWTTLSIMFSSVLSMKYIWQVESQSFRLFLRLSFLAIGIVLAIGYLARITDIKLPGFSS